jgi:predicted regulator of Ras-like GTPase activity (Roadblock/LC7/MglB family)
MVKETLNKFLILTGVTAVLVIGEKGDIIASVKSGGLSTPEAVAAAMSFVMAESYAVAHRVGKAEFLMVVIEFADYVLIAGALTEDKFLAIIAKTNANIGQISLEMKKYKNQIITGL